MLLIPRVSEKAYGATLNNIYVFDVPMSAVKADVKRAIEGEFKDVKVKDVRLVVVKGKPKAFMRSKRSRGLSYRSDFKKAYVTLASGKIEIQAFKAEEPAENAAGKDAKQPADSKKTEVSRGDAEANVETKKAGLFAKRRTGRRGDK
jgi:ribosomal protein L23